MPFDTLPNRLAKWDEAMCKRHLSSHFAGVDVRSKRKKEAVPEQNLPSVNSIEQNPRLRPWFQNMCDFPRKQNTPSPFLPQKPTRPMVKPMASGAPGAANASGRDHTPCARPGVPGGGQGGKPSPVFWGGA